MQGLRGKENEEFERFFELVQEKAKEENCVFFLDYGIGDTLEKDGIEYEDCQGWLIPVDLAEKFEPAFMDGSAGSDDEGTEWSEYAAFVEWSETDNGIQISVELL